MFRGRLYRQLPHIMRTLDESFDPATPRTFTYTLKKQTQNLGAEIYGTMARTLSAGFERLCFLKSTGQCQRGVASCSQRNKGE